MSLLREADGLLGVDALAAAAGLSVATVRHHLAALAEAGLVRATASAGPGRGRPKLRYTAVRTTPPDPDTTGDTAYRDLAAALMDALAAQGRKPAARAAGRAWGRRLAQAGEGAAPPAERVFAHAARMGFAPEAAPAPAGTERLLLHACPYRELARDRPEIVCALHQGVLDGLLEDSGTGADLVPFVGPDLCRADLHPGPRTG